MDPTDEATGEEVRLYELALSSTRRQFALPKDTPEGVCRICKTPINDARREFLREWGRPAFLCGSSECEHEHLQDLARKQPQPVDQTEDETEDDDAD